MNAVNQSLGRVIRHINDFGTMICIDERYYLYEKYFSFWIRDYCKKHRNNNTIKIKDFLQEQREKFIDIIEENKKLSFQKDSNNQSGFNSVINFDSNLFLGIKKKHKEIMYEIEEEEYEFEDEGNYEEEENYIIDSNEEKEYDVDPIKNNDFKFQRKDHDNINIINIQEVPYKNNYNEIFEQIIKPKKEKEKEKENDICEDFKVSVVNEKDNIFEKEEKQGKELLKSLKAFLIDNKKEFNKILNKYK